MIFKVREIMSPGTVLVWESHKMLDFVHGIIYKNR